MLLSTHYLIQDVYLWVTFEYSLCRRFKVPKYNIIGIQFFFSYNSTLVVKFLIISVGSILLFERAIRRRMVITFLTDLIQEIRFR